MTQKWNVRPGRPIIIAYLVIALFLPACDSAQPTPTITTAPPSAAAQTVKDTAQDSVATATPVPAPTDAFANMRQSMVDRQIRARGVENEAVLQAMLDVPRHRFVPAEYQPQAYNDHPLPIGFGQTISQPYIVALMTELIDIQPGDRVLEIGTGSGYQAAVLAEITDNVYTIEIIPELSARAQEMFDALGYDDIKAKQGDGYWGWEENVPFEAIIVTAAPDHIPQPLVNQLADGGRMVIPIGPPGGYQSLWILERHGEEIVRRNWGGVRFVPLTRE